MAKTRIMLADDHTLFRQGIRTLISAEADMEVVGEASNGGDAVEKATELGVEQIIPLETERTEKGLRKAAEKRSVRWNRIAREASEQSRRARLPEIHVAVALADVFGSGRRSRRDAADRGRRLGIGIHIGRRGLALKTTEQEIEQPFGTRRARYRHEHGCEQCGQCGKVPIQRFDATRVHHGSIVEKDSRSDDENACGTGKRRIRKHA